jgi:uncharacterized protein YidB (DUF937 family)
MGAIEVVMAEKELKGGIPEPFDFLGVQVYHNAVANWFSAGSNRSISAFDFNEAEATGSKGCNSFS